MVVMRCISVQQISIPFIHSSEPKEPHKVLIKKQGVTSNHSLFALIVSEFRHPKAMQVAVCVNSHRFFTAQFKNSAGSLPRIQIADLPAVLSLHKNPLNIVNIRWNVIGVFLVSI